MRTIKPMTLGLLSRPFEYRRQFHLGVAALSFLPMAERPQLLKETALWQFLAVALPGQALDAVIPKSQAEFLVTAHAHAPGGSPVTQLRAGAMLGSIRKMLQLVGPRQWDGKQVSAPEPFTTMPLDWEHALGGEGVADNPLGVGGAILAPNPPPNVVLPTILAHPSDPGATQAPVGFGAVDQMWPARAQYAGTYDTAWLEQDFPGFAKDIDWRFFNIAPADQQFPGPLNGDEPYAFQHLHAEQSLIQGRLPGIVPRLFLIRADQPGLEEIPLALTTVWFFPGALRLVLIHHGRAAIATETATDVAGLVLGADRLGAPRDTAWFQSVMEKRLVRKTGPQAALHDEDLVPAEWLPDDAHSLVPKVAESLESQRLKRRRQREYDAVRARLREKNVPPDQYDIPDPEPDAPLPTIDELPAMAEKMAAEAEKKKAEAEAKADAAERELDEKLLAMGKSPEEVAHMRAARHAKPKGPPRFSAAEMRVQLQAAAAQKRALGLDASDIEAQLADPAVQAEWDDAEQKLADAYVLSAHFQDPAERLDEAQSATARAALLSAEPHDWRRANFCGADLSGIDLSNRDLAGIWLDGADLSGANLSHANLSAAILAHATLDGCRLDGANLQAANCGGTSLRYASLRNANLKQALLSKAELDGADFSGTDLAGTEFLETNFGRVCFAAANAPALKVLNTPLPHLQAGGIKLTKACFLDADMAEANFSAAVIVQTAFVNCRLSHANFSGATLDRCAFVGSCDLSGANFLGARLIGANLRGMRLNKAILSRADMSGADLSGADLTAALMLRANGMGARLADACLAHAMLRGSNFSLGDLARADLRGADLREVSVYQANLARTRLDRETRVGGMHTKRMRYLPLYDER